MPLLVCLLHIVLAGNHIAYLARHTINADSMAVEVGVQSLSVLPMQKQKLGNYADCTNGLQEITDKIALQTAILEQDVYWSPPEPEDGNGQCVDLCGNKEKNTQVAAECGEGKFHMNNKKMRKIGCGVRGAVARVGDEDQGTHAAKARSLLGNWKVYKALYKMFSKKEAQIQTLQEQIPKEQKDQIGALGHIAWSIANGFSNAGWDAVSKALNANGAWPKFKVAVTGKDDGTLGEDFIEKMFDKKGKPLQEFCRAWLETAPAVYPLGAKTDVDKVKDIITGSEKQNKFFLELKKAVTDAS